MSTGENVIICHILLVMIHILLIFLVNNKKYKCGNIQTYNYCKDKEYVNVIFRTRKFKNNVVKHAVIRVYFD